MSNIADLELLKAKLKFLGYKNGVEKLIINKSYEPLIKELQKLSNYKLPDMDEISLNDVKREARNFFEKYFNVHDIYYIDKSTISDKRFQVSDDMTESDVIKMVKGFYSTAQIVSPFNLPVELIDGHSFIGELQKPIIIMQDEELNNEIIKSGNRVIPFSLILLGNNLTKLSAATYIHEICHAEQESIPGYTDSFLNKEVISIFLEKLSALELDSTGRLLEASERMRFSHLLDVIRMIRLNELTNRFSCDDVLDNYKYLYSTLIAQKLFDLYIQERKQRKRDKYIYEIQDIFDGKKQVEDMISNHDVTIQKAKDLSLIKRHI